MKKKDFAFKDLNVWHKAIAFANDLISLSEDLNSPQKHYRLIGQFESASASVFMNIAEGKGRNSQKEFIQYLYIVGWWMEVAGKPA